MSKNSQTIESITEKMIAKMEQGNLVWNKPWKGNMLPQNYNSKKAYKGWNLFATLFSGFESPYWLTANQIKQLGGSWSGQGTLITFWSINKYEKKNDKGETEEKNSFLLKYYYVWNAEQITGIDFKMPIQDKSEIGTCEELEKHIYNMDNPVNIKHTLSDQAYYTPTFDYINMPLKTQFKGTAEYYSTLIHEVVHSTGHSSRLNRMAVNDGKFDSKEHSYSFEELVAEIGASFLNAMFGIATEESENNSASYLQGWLKKLKQDKQMLFKASTEAQKAVNYILNDKAPSEEVADTQIKALKEA
jgi:antirestriction protein ArdC